MTANGQMEREGGGSEPGSRGTRCTSTRPGWNNLGGGGMQVRGGAWMDTHQEEEMVRA